MLNSKIQSIDIYNTLFTSASNKTLSNIDLIVLDNIKSSANNTYMHVQLHAYIHTYRQTYIQTYIHTYIHTMSQDFNETFQKHFR